MTTSTPVTANAWLQQLATIPKLKIRSSKPNYAEKNLWTTVATFAL